MSSDKTYQTHVYQRLVFKIYNSPLGMNYDHVDKACSLIDFALSVSKRVLCIRFDLRMTSCPNDNRLMSMFQKLLRRNIERLPHYGHKHIFEFMWAREQVSSPNPHYHCCLLLNGNVFRSDYKLMNTVSGLWKSVSGGSVPFISNSSYMLTLRSPRTIQRAIYRISYMAKWDGKRKGAPYRHFGSTNSKPDSNSPLQRRLSKIDIQVKPQGDSPEESQEPPDYHSVVKHDISVESGTETERKVYAAKSVLVPP